MVFHQVKINEDAFNSLNLPELGDKSYSEKIIFLCSFYKEYSKNTQNTSNGIPQGIPNTQNGIPDTEKGILFDQKGIPQGIPVTEIVTSLLQHADIINIKRKISVLEQHDAEHEENIGRIGAACRKANIM